MIKHHPGMIATEVRYQYEKQGHTLFSSGDYNLNIFGIRACDRRSDKFNDLLGCLYKIDHRWNLKVWPITTDPGLDYRHTFYPGAEGTAILAPGQYRKAYKLGKHKGMYDALVQVKPVRVFRDDNKDDHLDYENEESGMFGINIHRAHSDKIVDSVGKYSAGCQVFASPYDYKEFISLCKLSASRYGTTFTYTLLG